MKRKHRRLYMVVLGLLALGGATALVLTAMDDALVYFYTPSDLQNRQVSLDRRLRIGGLVEEHSVTRQGTEVRFVVTDLSGRLPVVYAGVLPDLFREGQGVVAEGRIDRDGLFHATEVLAKHDEKYMPKEVKEALQKSGQWQDKEQQP